MTENNSYKIGQVEFRAFGDRILVVEDKFRSGYECAACAGTGRLKCENCSGTGKSAVVLGARCSTCNAIGTITCPTCGGKGGTLVVPQNAERRPTTGEIVSCGEEVKALQLGESVMYHSFAGQGFELEAQNGERVFCRVLHESEILCRIHGHLELRTLKTSSMVPL